MPRHDSSANKPQKKSKSSTSKKATTKPGRSSNFNAFLNMKLAELKKSHPDLSHAEKLKQINDMWKVETGKKK